MNKKERKILEKAVERITSEQSHDWDAREDHWIEVEDDRDSEYMQIMRDIRDIMREMLPRRNRRGRRHERRQKHEATG